MTNPNLPSQSQANRTPFTQPSLAWKWEKKHWLLVIAVGCFALWWFGSQIKEIAWLQNISSYLPLIGSLAFAGETILKLA